MEFILFFLAILVFSIVLHEVSHGMVANSLGDPTAKHAGRLTLNPIPHIDPFGSIILPILLIVTTGAAIAWAKPVPVNPANLRGKYDELKVSLMGPATNFLLALFFGLSIRFFDVYAFNPMIAIAFGMIVFINLILGVFNLLPFPPLDGSHIISVIWPRVWQRMQIFIAQYWFFWLAGLFAFVYFFGALIFLPVIYLFIFLTGDPILFGEIQRVLAETLG